MYEVRYKRLLSTAAFLLGVGVAMQFIRPELASGPITGDLNAPAPVKHILRTACYDCHSNETRLPWFDRIAPAYWMAVADVKHGRQGLNFSEFDKLSAAQQRAALFEAVNQTRLGAMPPKDYEFVHPESRITPQQLAVLEQYLRSSAQDNALDAKKQAAADEQYRSLLVGRASAPTVHPTANGIEFQPEYKNWRSLSSTDRFDNNTMRVVLGNEVAIQAIEQGRINPWPDGTMFAKVAWDQVMDQAGDVRTGQFLQVEFMIKDHRKYASTKGWGWARWRGADLQPYGKTAAFTAECVGCHTPMRDNDFVFTTPIKDRQ